MREVIQRVLTAEAEAKGLVAAARQEADGLLSAARRESDEVVARVTREARLEAQRLVEAAVSAAQREKEDRLTEVAAGLETGLRLDEGARQDAIAGALHCICRPHRTP